MSKFRDNQVVVMLLPTSPVVCGCVVHFGRALRDPTTFAQDIWLAEMRCEITRPGYPDGDTWLVRTSSDRVLTLNEARSLVNDRLHRSLEQLEILNDPRLDDWEDDDDDR